MPASASAYLALVSALPALHSAALGLLRTLLAVGGGTLAPLYGAAANLVSGLLRRLGAGGGRSLVAAAWPVREQARTPLQRRLWSNQMQLSYWSWEAVDSLAHWAFCTAPPRHSYTT